MLKDKGLLALVKKKAAEQEGKEPDQQFDMKEIVTYVSALEKGSQNENACKHVLRMCTLNIRCALTCSFCSFQEPKLTRSRVRQELMSGGVSPEKMVWLSCGRRGFF